MKPRDFAEKLVPRLAKLDQPPSAARLEVALLVEDAVVGQTHLAVHGGHGAVG